MMEPRWYQVEAVEAPFAYWNRDALPSLASPCIEVPTGGGKSAIIGWTTRRLVEEFGCRVIVASHRSELLEQDAADMREVWAQAPIGMYSAGLNRREGGKDVVIAGVQSAYRSAKKLGHRDVMIIDEAHLVNPEDQTQYALLIAGLREINPDMRIIGYTATPYRTGQGYLTQGENALFSAIPYRVSVRKLIDEGFLSALVTGYATASIDTSQVASLAGEFKMKDLELASNVQDVTDHVADDVHAALSNGRRLALVYGVTVNHAAMLRNALRMRGVPTEMIDGSMDRPARRAIISAFKAGEIRALTSCDVLTTGFNVPAVDVVALVRPTQSTALYVQIVGRGMRIAEGKKDCIILDYGGNIARHGPIDDIRIKAKEKSKGGGEAPTKECPNCNAEVPPAVRTCPHCDFAFPEPERKANTKASSLPALSIKQPVKRTRHMVGDVSFAKHVKRDASGPATCRLDYFEGGDDDVVGKKIASEWLCFDHEEGSFAWRKAHQWWDDNVGSYHPDSVDDAVRRLKTKEFPTVIAIDVEPDGEFTRVVKVLQKRPREPGEDSELNGCCLERIKELGYRPDICSSPDDHDCPTCGVCIRKDQDEESATSRTGPHRAQKCCLDHMIHKCAKPSCGPDSCCPTCGFDLAKCAACGFVDCGVDTAVVVKINAAGIPMYWCRCNECGKNAHGIGVWVPAADPRTLTAVDEPDDDLPF
jgi:DNA repair protein RadD